MANPAPEKVIFARHEIRVGGLGSVDHAIEFLPQFRRGTLISIQTKDPVVAGMRHRFVPKPAEAVKFMLEHLIGKFAADFFGRIGAVGIDHDQFIRPRYGFQARAHVRLIVVSDDIDR